MMSDKMNFCADLILTAAIEDMASIEKISFKEARTRLIESSAYDSLYDESTCLWMEGPDYFRDFYRRVEDARARNKP